MSLALADVRAALGTFTLTANVELGTGTRTAVIGPSGGGKSTLLAAIAGFVPLVAGAIAVDGRDLAGVAPGARPVSILFQDNNLFPHLSVADNVGLGIRPDLRLSPEDRDRVGEALKRVGLADHARRKPAALSGGQQGRAALARALLRARPVLLLDEPFAALGPALKAEMLDLVREITQASGATLLMVTHDTRDAERIATDVIVVDDGTVAPPVPTDRLLAAPSATLRRYLGV